MIRTKELLEYCCNDDNAVRIVRQAELNRFNYFLFCGFYEIVNWAFFGICGYATLSGIIGIPFAIIMLFYFPTLQFCDEDAMDYINTVLQENATVQNYKIRKTKYPYVYIFNDEDELLKLKVSSIYNFQKSPYIRCRVYFQLRNNEIKKIYSPICCINFNELIIE